MSTTPGLALFATWATTIDDTPRNTNTGIAYM